MSAARQLPAVDPRATPLARVLELLVDAFAERVAVALDRILRDRAAQTDEAWGLTSQKTLPPWIHPDTYVEACRMGAIPGAKLWRRQWLAPREAVLAWVAVESREAENLRAGFGTVFPPLPSALLEAPRMSQGLSQGSGPCGQRPVMRRESRFGVRDSNPAEGVRHPPRERETPADLPATPSPVGGSEGLSGGRGTIPGTLLEESLRASLAAAIAAGDYATAEGLIALLRSAARPPAEVVDLAARRTRGG